MTLFSTRNVRGSKSWKTEETGFWALGVMPFPTLGGCLKGSEMASVIRLEPPSLLGLLGFSGMSSFLGFLGIPAFRVFSTNGIGFAENRAVSQFLKWKTEKPNAFGFSITHLVYHPPRVGRTHSPCAAFPASCTC
jgi:hypothetical protein